MSNKHTPGPWFFGISGCPERGSVPFDYKAPGYYDNVGIFGADGQEVVGCHEYEVFRSPADARLITAAPDLLDACENALDRFGDSEGVLNCRAVRLLREAIAKART